MSDPELDKLLAEKRKKMTEASNQQEQQTAPIVKLTTDSFSKIANGPKPLFVDFWAAWCGPCRTMEPIVERLAKKYSGKITVGKLNVDEESAVATEYDVESIPTFMIFSKGKPVAAVIGAVYEASLDQLIQKAVPK